MSVGSLTIAGTAISTWARHSRLLDYASGSRRGKNLIIPHRDGEYADATKWFTKTDLMLEVAFSRSPTTLENVSGFLAALTDPVNLVTLAGSSTFHGSIQTAVELMAEPTVLPADPSVYRFRLRNPKGVWEDVSATVNAGNPPSITTTGDRPVDDMALSFTHVNGVASFLEHTDSNSVTSRITIDSGGTTGTYVVDLGARTVKRSGADQDAFLTVDQPWWMRFEPNLAQSFTSNVSVSVSWRDKWAV